MPIDPISQRGAALVKPAEPKRAVQTPAQGGTAPPRQSLPGSGETLPPSAAASQTDPATITQVVSRLNDYVQTLRRDLVFRVDKDTEKVVVTVVDPENGEVIRQIPSEEVMAVARALGQIQQGLLLDTKV